LHKLLTLSKSEQIEALSIKDKQNLVEDDINDDDNAV